MTERAEDYRVNPETAVPCAGDVEKFCADIKPRHHETVAIDTSNGTFKPPPLSRHH